jgi:hypothetical protein
VGAGSTGAGAAGSSTGAGVAAGAHALKSIVAINKVAITKNSVFFICFLLNGVNKIEMQKPVNCSIRLL